MPPIELPMQAGELFDAEAAHELEARVGDVFERQVGKIEAIELTGRGSIEAGPVEPLHEPSVFAQITYQRFVSMYLPGPIISSHQPGEGSSAFDAACALGERPVRMKTALLALGVERAPGFVGERRARERAAALHRERRGQVEVAAGVGHALGAKGSASAPM